MSEISEKLKDISTEALLQEVNDRSEFYVGLSMNRPEQGKVVIGWRFKGDHDFCSGLCKTLAIKIADHKAKTVK